MRSVWILALAFSAPAFAQGWRPLHKEQGVQVSTKTEPGGRTLIRGEAVLKVPAAELKAVLMDIPGFPKWIPSLSEWKVLERSEKDAYVYARHDLSWPMDDRDYSVRFTWKSRSDGAFQLNSKSTTTRGPPPVKGVIRLKQVRSRWMLIPQGSDRTRVTYTYHGELGGRIPRSVAKQAWKTEPPSLLKAFEKEAIARRK